MRRKSSATPVSRRDALRWALWASAAHAPLWAACRDASGPVGGAHDPLLLGAAGAAADAEPSAGDAPYDPAISWYMQNEYAPTQAEHDIFELEVVGAIPPELDGTYFRNGPNHRGKDLGHKFAGHGMVHAVALRGGQALWYRNRYVRTLAYERPDEPSLDPKASAANTSVISHAARLLAVSEVGLPFELSPSDLSTVGAYDFSGQLADPFTGHPKIDPVTGEMIGIGYPLAPPFLRYYRIDKSGAMVSNEPIDLPLRRDGFGSKLAMMHDFAITATKTLFLQMPVVFDLEPVVQGGSMPFRWDESNGTHIGVMPRAGRSADVVWIAIDPCWIFHVVNAYDEGPDRVILDVVRHDPPFWADGNTGLLPGAAKLARYTIDLRARSAKLQTLDDRMSEFPRIDDRLMGRPQRYAYLLEFDHGKMFDGHVTGILKYDFQRGALETRQVTGPEFHLDEAMFVPASSSEDGGYLIAFAYERETKKSSVLIFDASNLTAPPIARVKLPVRVPIGLHGYWLPSSA